VDAAIARHRKKFWRRAVRVGVVLFLVVVGLAAAALVAVSVYFTDARIRDLVVREMNGALAGAFEIDGLSVSVLSASAEIRGLKVRDPDGALVLSAGQVRGRIEPRALLRNEVRLLAIAAENVQAHLFPPPSGSSMDPEAIAFTLVAAFEPASPSEDSDAPPWTVRIDDLSAAGLGVTLATGDGFELAVTDGDLKNGRLAFEEPGLDLSMDGALDRVRVVVDDYDFDLSTIRAEGLVLRMGAGADGHIDLGTVIAAYAAPALGAPGNLRATGRIDGLGFEMDPMALDLAIAVAGEVDLGARALQAFIPEDVVAPLALGGRADLEIAVTGTPEAPRVGGTFAAIEMRLSGETVTEATGRFAWEADALRLDDLVLAFAEARVEGSILLDLGAELLGWSATANLRDVPVRRLAGPWLEAFEVDAETPLPERVSGEISLEGRGVEPPIGRLTGDLHLAGLPADLPPGVPDPVRVRATARFDASRVHLEPLRLTGAGLDVTARGRVSTDVSGPVDLAIRALHLRPGDLMRAYDVAGTARQVDLTGHLTGTFLRPRAEGTLRLDGVRLPDLPVADLVAPFRFAEGTVHLAGAVANFADGVVRATGSITALTPDLDLLDDPRLDLQVRVGRLRLAAFTEDRVEGRLAFDGRVSGTVSAPVGAGVATVDGLVVEGIPFSRAHARVGADGAWVDVETFELDLEGGGRLTGAGRLRLEDQGIEARFEAREVPVALANAFLDEPLPVEGSLEADGTVSGSVEDPRFEARILAGDLQYEDVAVGWVDAHLSGGLARIALKVGVEHEAGRIEAAGWVSPEDETLDVRVAGHRLQVERMPFIAGSHPLEGRVTVDLHVQDRLRAPEVVGTVIARTLAFDGETYGNGRVEIDIRPTGPGVHALVLDVLGATRLEAEAHLDPAPRIVASGRLEDLSVAWLVPPLAEHDLDAALKGRLDLAWAMDPAMLSVDLHLDSLTVDMSGQRLESRRPVHLSWDGEKASLEGLSLAGPHGTFEAWGVAGETLDLGARGTLEMELLGPFIDGVARASGTLEIDLVAQGARDAPRIEGEIGIARAIRLRPRRMIREVEIGTGRARFEPGKVVLERLSGQVHGGIFRASGEVTLDGLEPDRYDLTFSGQNLPLRTQEILLEANADIRVTGQGAGAKVGGRIDVVRGRYLQKFELDRFVFRPARRVVVEEPLAQRMPFLADIDLDMRVTSLGAMEIRADAGAFSLDMVLDADLKVMGTAAQPILEGRVEANRGGLKFPRARLDVVRSVIEFVPRPGEAIRPRIDLRAEGEVSPPAVGEMGQTTYFVTLSLDGDLEEMILDLTSDPGLDRLEILSLLVTGRLRPTDSLAGGDGRQAEAAMVFAGAQLAEPLTRLVTQQLESLLNLELELSAEITTAGVSLAAGKEVTRRLRLEWAFERAFGDAQASSAARARYLLSDRVFVEGTTEAFSGQSAAGGAPRDGARTHLELKLRLYGE
jgi:autotransporter translocation and assembly factor TamB